MSKQLQARQQLQRLRELGVRSVSREFDPRRDPALIENGLLAGYDLADIAVMLGVPLSQLSDWIETEPKLARVHAFAASRNAEVLRALYDAATGFVDPETGQRVGVNVSAAKFIVQANFGMTDKPREDAGDDLDRMSPAEVAKYLEKAAVRLERVASRNAPEVIDVGVTDLGSEPE